MQSHGQFCLSVFQSTLPRRERQYDSELRSLLYYHFNPRSREGSDYWYQYLFSHFCNFNPRSREGSDSRLIHAEFIISHISIHAPAKGATNPFNFYCLFFLYFNPRSREGSDFLTFHDLLPYQFQSTLPRRERLNKSCASSITSNFNPRSREGSDDLRFR